MINKNRFLIIVFCAALVCACGCSDDEKEVMAETSAPSSEAAPSATVEPAAAPIAVPEPNVPVVERRIVTITNIVTVTKTILVTNVVATEQVERPVALSSRKTAPYIAICDNVPDLRRRISDAGAHAITMSSAVKAIVEARLQAAEKLAESGFCEIRPLKAEDKIGPDVEGKVVIFPLSSIDVKSVLAALKDFGADGTEEKVNGRAAIRAELAKEKILEIAARGDVLRIEKGE